MKQLVKESEDQLWLLAIYLNSELKKKKLKRTVMVVRCPSVLFITES